MRRDRRQHSCVGARLQQQPPWPAWPWSGGESFADGDSDPDWVTRPFRVRSPSVPPKVGSALPEAAWLRQGGLHGPTAWPVLCKARHTARAVRCSCSFTCTLKILTQNVTLNFKLIFIPSMSHRVLVLWCPYQAHAYLWHPSAAACFCLCGPFQFAHTYRRSEAVEPSHVIAALEHFLTTSPLSHLCLSVSPAAKTEDLTPRETRQVSHSIPGKW